MDELFNSGPFMRHGHCYYWTSGLVTLNAFADALIVLAHYAIPLMDFQLPGMDGLTLARQLKLIPAYQHNHIVALTSHAMKGDEQKAREAGCDGYITKPLSTRDLPAQLAAVMAGQRGKEPPS